MLESFKNKTKKGKYFNWDIDEIGLQTNDGAHIENHKAIRRNDDYSILGVVKSSYTSIHNYEVEDVATILEDVGCKYLDHGEFTNGQKIWIQFDNKLMPESDLGKNDQINSKILLATGHGGKMTFQLLSTLIRIVCMNTFHAALKNGDNMFTLRHTSKVKNRLEDVKLSINQLAETTKHILDNFERMSNTPYTGNEEKFFANVLSYEKKPRPIRKKQNGVFKTVTWTSPSYSAIARDNMKILKECHATSGAEGTQWGMFNAVTNYVDHQVNSRKDDYSWFGSGQTIKQIAYNTLNKERLAQR